MYFYLGKYVCIVEFVIYVVKFVDLRYFVFFVVVFGGNEESSVVDELIVLFVDDMF